MSGLRSCPKGEMSAANAKICPLLQRVFSAVSVTCLFCPLVFWLCSSAVARHCLALVPCRGLRNSLPFHFVVRSSFGPFVFFGIFGIPAHRFRPLIPLCHIPFLFCSPFFVQVSPRFLCIHNECRCFVVHHINVFVDQRLSYCGPKLPR